MDKSYAELYPFFKSTVLALKDFGKIGFAEAINISQWIIIPWFGMGTIALFFWFEKENP